MTWTTAKDLKTQVERLWERGELLRDALTARERFPLRLRLKGPGSNDITERFDEVRAWSARLADISWVRLEWKSLRHRVQGEQHLPSEVWVESRDQALAWLGRQADWQRFQELVAITQEQQANLLPWLEKRPLQALELSQDWPRLLAVVSWLQAHPRPGIYLRQVDLPGVHSKFIEGQRAVLAELLDLALPAEAIAQDMTGLGRFAARYGFLDKPLLIRFRALDEALGLLPEAPLADMTLDAGSFSRLRTLAGRVFITENEINYLAFPRVTNALVIFGAGYGWEALAQCRWLRECEIHYWGDIDTHGFGILDQLRGQFPAARSLLMDTATLLAHRDFWGQEHKPLKAELHRLTPAEAALYQALRQDEYGQALRLEQEHIGYDWLARYLVALFQK